jgi:hypothetical protein
LGGSKLSSESRLRFLPLRIAFDCGGSRLVSQGIPPGPRRATQENFLDLIVWVDDANGGKDGTSFGESANDGRLNVLVLDTEILQRGRRAASIAEGEGGLLPRGCGLLLGE